MKLIIAKGRRKRVIETPFDLCIGTKELEELIEILRRERAAREDRVSYGWMNVTPFTFNSESEGEMPRNWED